jgi:hypothetical protein
MGRQLLQGSAENQEALAPERYLAAPKMVGPNIPSARPLVGDFIDRGPDQHPTLTLVDEMMQGASSACF